MNLLAYQRGAGHLRDYWQGVERAAAARSKSPGFCRLLLRLVHQLNCTGNLTSKSVCARLRGGGSSVGLSQLLGQAGG